MRITAILLAALIFMAGAAVAAELPFDVSGEAVPETAISEESLASTQHEEVFIPPIQQEETLTPLIQQAEVRALPERQEDTVSAPPPTQEKPHNGRRNQRTKNAGTAPRQRPGKSQQYISLDFTDVDLQVLIKFMSEQTGQNFVFDERVQGKVSIVSPTKMTEEEAYNVFLSVLQVKGFATVNVGNSIKIVPSREIRQESIPTDGKGKPARHSGEFITRLISLKHTESPEVIQLLTPLLSKDGMISSFPSANTIMLIDSRQNIERLMGILNQIDIESQNETKLFQLTYASAQNLANTLEQLFPSATPPGAPAPQAGRGTARRAAAQGSSTIRFIPEMRTNNLIVIAPPETLPEISELIARLDVPLPSGSGKINVYYLENADAEETATVLTSLTGLSGTSPAQLPQGMLPQGQQMTPAGMAAASAVIAEFESRVKITADKATNSLVIVASPNDYKTLVGVIKKLDIRRRQVFVEAMILEIDLDKSRDLGIEWRTAMDAGKNGTILGGTNFNFSGNVNSMLTALASGNPMLFAGTGLLAGGIGGTVKLPDGTEVPAVAAILRAVQTRNDIKILSSPHLLTQNNKEAEIVVGENVPFIASQSRDTTNLANVINTVERKDVGVTLKITPHIHESEFVSMDIYQESSALKESSGLDQSLVGPTTTKRSAKTTVLVKSGDTILIGGIVQETKSEIESKVPILGSIPLLGWLFKYSSKTVTRTNLVILLTPHIIQEPGVFTEKLAERQRKILLDFDQNNDHIRSVFPPKQETENPGP
ncbi:MAG: type II secretion system secretin GspD [Syntrophorhabdaceae bacterium]|nr:type II secretion system secretin GspD [Syntrophorhabdaceae bacterium]